MTADLPQSTTASPQSPFRLNSAARSVEEDVLPLTAFERFLLMCDAPDSPMVIRVSMFLRGNLEPEHLESSFRAVLDRHPLFSAVIGEHRGATAWLRSRTLPQLLWRETDNPLKDMETDASLNYINPRREPLLQATAVRAPDGVLIEIDVHHCAADGGAIRQFVTEWMHYYDRAARQVEPSLSEMDVTRLVRRGTFHAPGVKEPIAFKDAVRNFYVTVRGRTARLPLRRTSADSATEPSGHGAVRVLSTSRTARLRSALKAAGVTLNDLFATACISTFARQFPDLPQSRYITLLNPVDLRLPSDRRLPACNRFGVALLRRRLSESADLLALLPGIRDEMTYVKRDYVGAEFVRALTSADRVPGAVRFLYRSGMFSPTLQFTCLGDVTRTSKSVVRTMDGQAVAGDLTCDAVVGHPPVPPNVPICVSACESGQRLGLVVRTSSRFLTHRNTEEFMDELLGLVDAWVGQGDRTDSER